MFVQEFYRPMDLSSRHNPASFRTVPQQSSSRDATSSRRKTRWSRRHFCATSALLAFHTTKLLGVVTGAQADPKPVAWLDEIQTPPDMQPAIDRPLASLRIDEQGQPIDTVAAWERYRERLRAAWRNYLGIDQLRRPNRLMPEVVAEDRDAGVLRRLLRYEVEPGWTTEAYWLEPLKLDRPAPAAVVLHSTVDHSILQPAGLGNDPDKAFALKLAQRGFITISPRNYLWPTNDKLQAEKESKRFLDGHPGIKGMSRMLLDAQIAVDLLIASPHVDRKRLACVGHSLGAKEVLYLAAFDPRVAVTVSSEGGIGTRFSNWNAPWYLGPSIHDGTFDHEHHELIAMIAPRPFLLIGGDSADGRQSWPFIARAMEVYQLYGGRPPLGLYNHGEGHSVPPACEKRIYEWIEAYT